MLLKGNYSFTLFFHEPLHEKTKLSVTQFSRFAYEIIWSNVMSREKALIIGYEDPTHTEVIVKNLTHLNTASLFVTTKQRSQ